MTKQDIIDYIMETPGNTNPAILNQMIDAIGGDGGGGDFSTCTGTFIADGVTTGGVDWGNLVIIDTEHQYYGTNGGITVLFGHITGNYSFPVVLYNGEQNVSFYSNSEGDIVSISGNIELQENGYYKITGDFTMHVRTPQSM